MTLEEARAIIEERTGIPADLLTGTTLAEVVSRAEELQKLKEVTPANTPQDHFKEWLESNYPSGEPAPDLLRDIKQAARIEAGGYPAVSDGGEITNRLPDPRTPKEQFTEWFENRMSFDPKRGPDGWKYYEG